MNRFDVSLKLGLLEFDTAEAAAENAFLSCFQGSFYQPAEFEVTDLETGEITYVDLVPLHSESSLFSRETICNRLRQPVELMISESFLIPGRGTVLTGEIKAGILRTGDALTLHSNGKVISLHVSAIELNRQFVNEAYFPEQVGVLFNAVDLSSACSGDLLLGRA